ncbi:MAG: endolytic transglycosylase MltG, partial [Thermomicrobiales bacterium]
MVQWVVQILKIVTVVVMSGLVLLGGDRAFDYYQEQNTPDDLGRVYTVTIQEGDDVDAVAEKLMDAELISTDLYFKSRLRVESKTLEPGTYRLTKGQSVSQIIELITSEESVARTSENPVLTITVIEGWRTEQIAEELERLGLNGGADAFMEAVRSYPSDTFEFLADRPDPESLEGYLFPDTYNFQADTDPFDIIDSMLTNFDNKITPEMRARAAEMGLTLNQVLTFASLVEREAQVGEERPIIADVYLRRYQEGWRLDADPTVQYVIGEPGNWWPELSGEDLQVESPYNMYLNLGMPPGPIANPGYSSINAVL